MASGEQTEKDGEMEQQLRARSKTAWINVTTVKPHERVRERLTESLLPI